VSVTRPPLYVRRPFLAGLLRQLPLLVVLVTVGIGLLVVAVGHWRQGLVMIGLVLIGSAVLRLLLPVRRVGFLAVRSRFVDVVLLAGAGAALTVLVLMIPFPTP
jgi:multisubunit Na+/H+ antiporter MnhB subunit